MKNITKNETKTVMAVKNESKNATVQVNLTKNDTISHKSVVNFTVNATQNTTSNLTVVSNLHSTEEGYNVAEEDIDPDTGRLVPVNSQAQSDDKPE